MGHRALVARERGDGRYDCETYRWGRLDDCFRRRVVEDPAGAGDQVAAGASWTAVLEEVLDYLCHEALFVVDDAGEVASYCVCWLGLDPTDVDEPTVGNGAVVRVETEAAASDLRRCHEGARALAGVVVDEDAADPGAIRRCLAVALERASGDRTVLVSTP